MIEFNFDVKALFQGREVAVPLRESYHLLKLRQKDPQNPELGEKV